jgi:hypothetical protein
MDINKDLISSKNSSSSKNSRSSSKNSRSSSKNSRSSSKKSRSSSKNSRSSSKNSRSSSKKSRSSSKKSRASSKNSSSFLTEDISLKLPEPLPNTIDYNERVATKMDKMFQLQEKVEPFIGDYFLENLFYLYLFNKYRMDCTLTHKSKGYMMEFILKIYIPSNPEWDIIQNDYLKDNVWDLYSCIIEEDEPIIIVPFIINVNIEDRGSFGHANLLIYRRSTRQLEHFEPHGTSYGGIGKRIVVQQINTYLETLVSMVNAKIENENDLVKDDTRSDDEATPDDVEPINLVKAHDVCPVIDGVQALEGASTIPKNAAIEPGGYCSAWSMFFTELCLKNPTIPSKQIYAAIMNKTDLYSNKNDYLRNVIRGYTCFINNKIAKHFSTIFDEPLTTAKIKDYETKRASMVNDESGDPDTRTYFNKFLEIMEVEVSTKYKKNHDYPEVKDRYDEFRQKIKNKTSSEDIISSDTKIAEPSRVSDRIRKEKKISSTPSSGHKKNSRSLK